jgi:transketolase C-terminal domain/subunit
VTLEEHVAAGGVGEMLRSLLGGHKDLRSLCVPQSLCLESGSQAALRRIGGLDAAAIVRIAKDII